jgi:hypothetical protein
MKLAGLRREIARGRLAYEVIANKQYTTLADIAHMRRLCRVKATALGSENSQSASSYSPQAVACRPAQPKAQAAAEKNSQDE